MTAKQNQFAKASRIRTGTCVWGKEEQRQREGDGEETGCMSSEAGTWACRGEPWRKILRANVPRYVTWGVNIAISQPSVKASEP